MLYRATQWLTLISFKVLLRLRYRYSERMEVPGGVLVCPNHLSHLDPMVVGCIARRRVNFLAKKALFKNKWFGKLLYALDCIPIDREASGIGGMKETLKKLKKGEPVVMFPEGERSLNGELLPLMTGFTALVKRLKIPIVPVGIHGTYEAWPRGASRPKLGKVKVVVGEPIEFSELESLTEQQMADYVGEKLAVCYNEAKEWNQN